MPSWLNNLTKNHPIFSLPPLIDSTSLPQPPSPNLSTSNLFPSSKSTSTPNSFLKSSKLRSSQSQFTSNLKEEGSNKGSRRKERIVLVRGVDLIVAVGKELRITSLVDVKASSEEKNLDEEEEEVPYVNENIVNEGEYKILSTPVIDFEIRQLILNATSKLLAVVGLHSIAVVVLPRKGWASTVGYSVECRSLLIGKFYHSLPASPIVADLFWHPLGANSSSLVVLTSDATIREYSIGEDAEEPSQTLSFLKQVEGGGNKRNGFSSDDVDASVAVGFCLGEGESDWGPLTIYGLMRNGDIVALCPFLPKKASIPASYIHSLSCFVSAKVDYLRTTNSEAFLPDESTSLTPFRPTRSSTPSNPFSQSTSSQLSSPNSQIHIQPNALSKRYNHQLRYVNSLVRQVPPSLSIQSSADTTLDPEYSSESSTLVSITLSHSISPALQGPFLLQPPPADLDNGVESLACDIVYINYKSAPDESSKLKQKEEEVRAGLGVIAVAYTDGKVEICLEVEKVEAKWGNEDDEFDEEEESEIAGPLLAVYETIDLGFSNELGKNLESGLEENYPTFVKDPLYPDTIYIYHALGAHCLSFTRWLESITKLSTSNDLGEEEDEEKVQKLMEREIRSMESSDIVWILKTLDVSSNNISTPPVVGLVMIQDIYLGYSILLITSELQAVGIELSLRVDLNLIPSTQSTSKPSIPSNTSKGVSSEAPAYLSLLDTPFTIPTILSNPTGVATVARRILHKTNSSTSPLIITPETLRFMGTTVETFRHSIRDLVSAADILQCRLELQMKELSRQLKKLNSLKSLSEDLNKSINSNNNLLSKSDNGNNSNDTIGMSTEISNRLIKVEAVQIKLLERTDKVLQTLIEGHEPILSSFEKKWFEELSRVEKEVLGNGGGGGGRNGGEINLETRAKRIIAQLESLTPALEAIKKKELDKSLNESKGTPGGIHNQMGGLGGNQMRNLELNLAHESKLIVEARQKLDRLTNLLANSSLS